MLFLQILSGESIKLKFQIIVLRPGHYTFDLIVQTDDNEQFCEKLTQFFSLTDSQQQNTVIESYFSKKSLTSNTYISCLALEVIHVEAKSPD